MTDLSKSTREKLGLFYLLTSLGVLGYGSFVLYDAYKIQKDPSVVQWWWWLIFVLVLLWFLAEIKMFVSGFRKQGVRGGLQAVYSVG